ncbi:MAG: L,D-transpeptidase [Patescibacteria group bacterium]
MKIRESVIVLLFFIITFGTAAEAHKLPRMYVVRICKNTGFHCLKIQKNDSWETVFPNEIERDLIKRINRMNIKLKGWMTLAIPNEIAKKTKMDFSPFEKSITTPNEKMIIFDPRLLAWAAYDETGTLINWGPASGGANWCDDINRRCRTTTGVFRILEKRGVYARSSLYPAGCHGNSCAPIPWFMPFHGGMGFHGSNNLPGYNASHGCVRLFTEDAKWLNQEFVEIGTKVIIKNYF